MHFLLDCMLRIKKIITDILNKPIFLKVTNTKTVINLYLYDSKYNICIRMAVLASFGAHLNKKKSLFMQCTCTAFWTTLLCWHIIYMYSYPVICDSSVSIHSYWSNRRKKFVDKINCLIREYIYTIKCFFGLIHAGYDAVRDFY